MKLPLRLCIAVTSLVLLAGCGGSDTTDATDSGDPAEGVDGPTVVLRDIAFSPETLSVDQGATVTWVFDDRGIPHNVVANDKSFESETKDSGRFTHTFDSAGSFAYVCTIHPKMKGTVKVR
ncbi:MAG: plastocyanin/azurin family copper-binding protein [Acidimicrobiales bacterium]